jgi:hypothetical protein
VPCSIFGDVHRDAILAGQEATPVTCGVFGRNRTDSQSQQAPGGKQAFRYRSFHLMRVQDHALCKNAGLASDL